MNLGPVSKKWLSEIGIDTIDQLKQVGSIPAYKQIKEMYPERVSLNLLWGLEAAVRDTNWRDLTDKDKEALKQQLSG